MGKLLLICFAAASFVLSSGAYAASVELPAGQEDLGGVSIPADDSVWSSGWDETVAPEPQTFGVGRDEYPLEPEATAPLPPAVLSGAAMLLLAGARKAVRKLR